MSVTTLNTSVTYTGTNSVGPFSFNFSISTPAALAVIQNGVTLASTSYTIIPVNNNYDNGGLVTLMAPCPVGQSLVLQRVTPLTQGSIFYDNLPLPMNQFENGLDKLTEIVQELAAQIAGITTTSVTAGTGITVTGNGTLGNPYVISTTGGGGGALTITSFTGGLAAEIGQSIVHPVFNDTYTGTPTTGSIIDTQFLTPFALVSPFLTAGIYQTYTHNAVFTVTFTLTLSNGTSSPTATQAITWKQRIFGGVAPTGATATVTASGASAVLSTGAIGTAGLGAEVVGQTFGPYSPSGQCIYLLLAAGSHAFIDAGTGFPFAFNAPMAVTFVNQYGVTVTMYLYQSTNSLTGNFQPKVTS